jgi:hypothetical protein
MSAGLHTVHLRVNDAATGQPTPVRVRLTGPDGTYYAPFGRLSAFSADFPSLDIGGNVQIDDRKYAYIDGTCEVRLPADTIHVEVSKGPEFVPIERDIALGVGQMAIRLNLERRCDLRSEGWYAGDTGCYFISPHAALLEGAGEGLAVVNLLALEHRRKGPALLPNLLAFSGQQAALQTPECAVVVNTLNQHAALGSLALLNSHRIVYPLSSGAPGPDDWTLADWCDQCHRKGGLVVWTRHPGAALLDGEIPADFILGKVDALELRGDETPEWYTLLDAGFKVALAGSGGKMSNRQALGGCRTYARLKAGESFEYKAWIEAVRAGRTVVTRGPLLQFTVNEQAPGATLNVAEGQTLGVRITVVNPRAGDRVEVLHNGAVVSGFDLAGDATVTLESEVASGEGGWLAARYLRREQRGPSPAMLAHTSPVYVQVAGRPRRVVPEAVTALQRYLERMLAWVAREGRFETDKQREDLAGVFRAAQDVLQYGGSRGGTP